MSRLHEVFQKGVPSSFFDCISVSNAEKSTIKAFMEVSLVSLTLRVRTLFKKFEKMWATLLYWFAMQQQTSTLTRPNFGLFDVNFSAEFQEFSLFF